MKSIPAHIRTSETSPGNRAMALAFLLFAFSLSAAALSLPDRDFSPQENRYLTQKPSLGLQAVSGGEYMSEFEEYMTDQFPGRDRWVAAKAALQKLSGQKENNDVYFAADGYLIGKPRISPSVIAEANLAAVMVLQAAGYEVALLVSPMAAEILDDKLPAGAYAPYQAELLDALRREAPGVFIDVEPNLRRASALGQQIYFRTDHHWTMSGAYQAYRAYMAWLGEEPPPEGAFVERLAAVDFFGTLWSKNSLPWAQADEIRVFEPNPADPLPADVYEVEYFDGSATWTFPSIYQDEYLQQKDKYAYFLGQNHPLAVIRRQAAPEARPGFAEGANAPPRKLLLFKDSYAHCFAPFLLPHFDEIHLADLRYWRQDPIAYMEEHQIRQVLFLYNVDNFSGDRSISQVGAYLSQAE